MATITEKQRVSLTPGAWIALISIACTGAAAWYATRAEAHDARVESAANSTEIRVLDKRTQRLEDTVPAALERIEKRLERMEAQGRR